MSKKKHVNTQNTQNTQGDHASKGKVDNKNQVAGKSQQFKQEVSGNKKTEETTEITMNFYSGMSMLTTVIAAVTTVIAMMVAGRGFYYILESIYDSEQVDLSFLNDKLVEEHAVSNLPVLLYVTAGMVVLIALLSLIGTVTAINPLKKPVVLPAVIMIVLGATAIVLYAVGYTQTSDITAMFSRVQQSRSFGVYNIYLCALIANEVCIIINLFGQMYGMKKYKETGKTC